MENKKINYQIKILYFLAILFIVSGHSSNGGINLFSWWFPYYTFHIGLFVFCSGYLFDKEYCNNVFTYIWKKFKKLIIPFFIWNVIYGIIVQFSRYFGFTIGEDFTLYNLFISPLINGHQFAYNLASWFIIPFFAILIFNLIINKIFIKLKINDWFLCILYLILGMIGIKLSIMGYTNMSWLFLIRFLYLLPFFGFGIIYKNKLEKIDNISNIKYFAIIFSIQLLIFTIAKKPILYTPSWCTNFDNIFNPYILGVTGISFWLRCSKIITPVLKNFRIVLYIASNTFSIMMHHFIGFMFAKYLFAITIDKIFNINDFNWSLFKSDYTYFYLPYGLDNWKIVYIFFGIAIPLLIKFTIDKAFKFLNSINLESKKDTNISCN